MMVCKLYLKHSWHSVYSQTAKSYASETISFCIVPPPPPPSPTPQSPLSVHLVNLRDWEPVDLREEGTKKGIRG